MEAGTRKVGGSSSFGDSMEINRSRKAQTTPTNPPMTVAMRSIRFIAGEG
ncbi:MAG: hypothetical protein ACT4OP_08725 [Actinomycetota bacterium]